MENDKFSKKASSWDNPQRTALAEIFVKEIQKNIKIEKDFEILEFGCGTGLVGLSFADIAAKLRMIDDSKAMLSVLKQKIDFYNFSNVEIFHGKISEYNSPENDLIVSSMALHHVEDIPSAVKSFHRLLKKGSSVIISDLRTEDGSFHTPDKVPHNGFDVQKLSEIFEKYGFKVSKAYTYNIIKKQVNTGEIKEFEQFIFITEKL